MADNNLEIPPNATIRQEYVKCGNPDCQNSHGPYLYAYWKQNKKLKKRYVGKNFEHFAIRKIANEVKLKPSQYTKFIFIQGEADKGNPLPSVYSEFTARGKTGKRGLVLINSIPWIRQWISAHPVGAPDAILFCSEKKNQMGTRSLGSIFKAYRREFFPTLLNTDIPDEDKQKIRNLLKKPWNPYVFRHTGLTHKHKILKEAQLRLHAGWAPGSQMHQRYIHLAGNEANETLLQDAGILSPLHEKDLLRPNVECPQCHKQNPPDTRFCYSCNMVLSYQGYLEVLEAEKKKADEVQMLKEQVAKMQESQLKIIELLNNPNMVQHIRGAPQDFIAAANTADDDTAAYLRQRGRPTKN
ncbi:MAG: site-specific integrase [Candidatus Nitrosopolaris sp.]